MRKRLTGRFFHFILFVLLISGHAAWSQQKLIDSLQKVVQANRRDTMQVKAMEILESEFIRKDIPRAKRLMYQSLQLSQAIGYKNGISTAWTQLTIACSKTGETDSAHYYLSLLKTFAAENPANSIVSNFNFTAGLIYKNEGKFKEALPYMMKALALFRQMNQKLSIAGQLLNIGNSYTSLGDYKNAITFHLEALTMFEELKNKRGESFVNQSLGNDFVAMGRPKEGLPYLLKALAQKEELADKRSIASAWMGLGDLYKVSGDFSKSLFYHLKALKAAEELKLTSEIGQSNFEIGSIYVQKKEFEKAAPYLKQSKVLARQMGDSALSKAVDAEVALLKSRPSTEQKLEQNLLSSLHTSVESGRKVTELSSYEHLIRFYEENKNFEKAFFYQNQYQHAKDSLQGLQVQLQIKNLEEQFKADKKEKEIALLKKDQQLHTVEIKRQKTIQYFILAFAGLFIIIAFLVINRFLVIQRGRRLIEIERVRNGIARDLHDDIGSTLSSINILSRMALENSMDETLRTRFSKIEDHSKKMMDMMSDIVWSINPVNDTADKTVIRMKEFAAEILEPRNIRYRFLESGDMSDARMNVNQRKNLFLIFKESMNNAAKYSQCTDITIDLSLSQHNFSLGIRDNGTGFNRSAVRRGNGLTNIEARAAMMGGSVKIETEEGKGTFISVTTQIT